ncbi:MAG: hypothetical protein ACO4AJ_10860 [Prochlorothrix sp.]
MVTIVNKGLSNEVSNEGSSNEDLNYGVSNGSRLQPDRIRSERLELDRAS